MKNRFLFGLIVSAVIHCFGIAFYLIFWQKTLIKETLDFRTIDLSVNKIQTKKSTFSKIEQKPKIKPKIIPKKKEIIQSKIKPKIVSKKKEIIKPKIEPIKQKFKHSDEKNSIKIQKVKNTSNVNKEAERNKEKLDEIKELIAKIHKTILQYKSYPKRAKLMKIEGKVTIQFTLGADGKITNLIIVQSSKYPFLDKHSLQTIEKASVYFPNTQKPITMKIPIYYRLY